MGVIKRYIHPTLDYATPAISSTTDRFLILRNLSQANNTGIIGQLSTLFEYTQEIFAELVQEASASAERIQSLGSRLAVLHETLPSVEAQVPEQLSLNNAGANYSNKSPEDACQFMAEARVASIRVQYEECLPPPNLCLLDAYAGESCLKKYTNPMFFFETWAEEQDRMYREAKKKRARRRKVRAAEQTTTKIAVKHVELRRNKFSAMGQEFANNPGAAIPSRPASSTSSYEQSPPSSELYLPVSTSSGFSPNPSPREEPPMSARSKSRSSSKGSSSSSSSSSTKSAPKKKEPKIKKERRSSKILKPEDLPAPPPQNNAPPPPKEVPYRAFTLSALHSLTNMTVEQPAAPTISAVAAAPAPAPPPPPPPPSMGGPPGGPPPPPMGDRSAGGGGLSGLSGQLTTAGLRSVPAEDLEKKAPVGKRSALLSAIQGGTQLKKVENQAVEDKPAETVGGFNVAMILARRAAIEFSDDEDSFGDGDDWD